MTELNTQLPTSGMLCGKSKWGVRKNLGDWEAWNPNTLEAAYYDTWREAMDYADQRARTREYVLPRISHSGEWVPDMPTLRLGWENHPAGTTFWVEDRGVNSIYVRPDELRPLALALLALHYQQEVPE